MADIRNWRTVPSDNATVGSINWAEGMSPALVNDSARAMMADLRGQFEDGGWFNWGHTCIYTAGDTFTVSGDQTAVYSKNRRVRASGTATGIIYGTVTASSYGTLTTVTVVWDSGALVNETITLSVSQLGDAGKAIPCADGSIGVSVVSAATVNLIATTGRYIHITGSTTITALGSAYGGFRRIITFDSSLTLTHNASSLCLPSASNIITGAGDTAEFICEGGSVWRCIWYARANGFPLVAPTISSIRGYIDGLIISNDISAPATAISVSQGTAAQSAAPYGFITLSGSSLIKTLTSTFTAGNASGCLDTGARTASTTYHIYIIGQSAVPTAADILASISASAPTMPSGWDLRRRIGSVITDASNNIVQFAQQGDEFLLLDPTQNYNSGNIGTTDTNITLDTPNGIRTRAYLSILFSGGNPGEFLYLRSPDAISRAASNRYMTSVAGYDGYVYPSSTYGSNGSTAYVRTNAARQIVAVTNFAAAAGKGIFINTLGWIDPRGKDQ